MAPKRKYILRNGPTIVQMLRATNMLDDTVVDKKQTIAKTHTSAICMGIPATDSTKPYPVFHNPVELVRMAREAPGADYTWFAVEQQWKRTGFAGICKNMKEELKSYLSGSMDIARDTRSVLSS